MHAGAPRDVCCLKGGCAMQATANQVRWVPIDEIVVPEGLIGRTHAMGLRVCLRAGDTPEAVRRMLAMELDYIPSNRMFAL